jgi:hypothetical protein
MGRPADGTITIEPPERRPEREDRDALFGTPL